jgi:AcrR family transcriptional regulator
MGAVGADSPRSYAPRLAPDERRTQLLDAALALIIEQGYEGVSMDAIARRAGVSKPVVYDAFGSREAFFGSLLEREESRALAAIAAAMPAVDGNDEPDVLIVEGVERLLDAVAAEPGPWRLILLPMDGTPAVVRERLDRDREAVLARLTQVVEWGLQRMAPPEMRLDVEVTAHAIFAVAEHFARLAVTDPGRIDPERVGAFVGAITRTLR